jgi:hypothetical protein
MQKTLISSWSNRYKQDAQQQVYNFCFLRFTVRLQFLLLLTFIIALTLKDLKNLFLQYLEEAANPIFFSLTP